jgi:imidazolonepropionase-like amidohydrolase
MMRVILLGLVASCLAAGCGPETITAPADSIVLTGRFFDGADEVVERGEIVIADGVIHCAGPTGTCAIRGAAQVIDIRDGTILPGLIDLHVHARPHFLTAFLAAGITTVRDASNTLEMVATLRSVAPAPLVVASGPLLDGDPSVLKQMSATAGRPGEQSWAQIMPVIVTTADEARAAVRGLAEQGVELIKLYEQLPAEAYAAAAEAAREVDLPVATDLGVVATRGLRGATVDALQAAQYGATSVEHLSGFALAYQRLGGDPMIEPLDDALLDRLADEFAATASAVVPTLVNVTHFTADEAPVLDDVPLADLAPLYLADHWERLHGWFRSPAMRERSAADLRFARAMLPRLRDRGVVIGAGTDTPAAPFTVPGGGIHQELAYLVSFGLTPRQALRAATGDAAGILGRDDLGRIRAGARADVIAVRGDPLTDISTTRQLLWVMQSGSLLDVDRLHDAARAAAEQVAETAAEPDDGPDADGH